MTRSMERAVRLLVLMVVCVAVAAAGTAHAQEAPWFVTPDRQDAIGLVRHAGAWHLALEETSLSPRALSLVPIGERGLGAEVARTAEPTNGRVLDVLPAGAGDPGPPWVVLSFPGSTPRVTAIRIGAAAPPVELVSLPGRNIEAQVLASAWRMGAAQPEGAVVWQGRTLAPLPRARPGDHHTGMMDHLPEQRTRERWLALGVGSKTRRFERLVQIVTSAHVYEERAEIALAAGGAVLVRAPYRNQGGNERWSVRTTKLDPRGRERERRDDLFPDRDFSPLSALIDAAGTTWLVGLSRGLVGGPSGNGRISRITVASVPTGRGSTPRVVYPGVEGQRFPGYTVPLECGGAVWVLASTWDSAGEQWLAFRADGTGTPIALTQRASQGRGRGVLRPVRTIETGCDGDRAVALLITERPRPERDRDPWPPGHVAFLTWNAR